MGAAASPITDFLRSKLASDSLFRGRAEFLLQPALKLETFPIEAGALLTPEDFREVLGWYRRTLRQQPWPRMPDSFGFRQKHELIAALRDLTARGVVTEDVVLDIVKWADRHPDRVRPVRIRSGFERWDEVSSMVEERNRNYGATGNGMLLRALPMQGVPIASSYEQALDHLYYLLWTRYVNEGVKVGRSINFTSLEAVYPERLALIGVRYVVARDAANRHGLPLAKVFAWNGYSIYEVSRPNTGGYSPTRVVFAQSVTDELRVLRDHGFDPEQTAVVAAAEEEAIRPGQWSPVRWSRLTISGGRLRFTAASTGGRAMAVLPFRYSRCWRPSWSGHTGHLVRVDLALIGVVFEGTTDVEVAWTAGYGPLAECLRADSALVAAVTAAAGDLP